MTVLRPATEADGPAIADLTRRAYARWVDRLGYEPKPMVADHGPWIEAGHVLVADEDGAVSGLLVTWPEEGHLLIYSVAVDPGRHGAGLGRRLMEAAEARARALGLDRIVLYTNERMTENVRLYEHLGYALFDRRPHATRPNSWAVYMHKPLPA